MPKKTFINLKEPKRKQITEAFLREFALKTYDEASLTEVVKELGIAKGSVYQYFDDKLELFMYLLGECTAVKKKYVLTVDRGEFQDFWTYFRALYEQGFLFDSENPLQSHFLYNLTDNVNSPSVKHLYDKLLGESVKAFEVMAYEEVTLGLFRNDVPVNTLGFMLYKLGVNIHDYLLFSNVINPKESIERKEPVFEGKKTQLLQVVDTCIKLVQPAFDK